MGTVTASVMGEREAKFVVLGIVDASQWFEFEPWPDDHYQITVKYENAGMLSRLVASAYLTSEEE